MSSTLNLYLPWVSANVRSRQPPLLELYARQCRPLSQGTNSSCTAMRNTLSELVPIANPLAWLPISRRLSVASSAHWVSQRHCTGPSPISLRLVPCTPTARWTTAWTRWVHRRTPMLGRSLWWTRSDATFGFDSSYPRW